MATQLVPSSEVSRTSTRSCGARRGDPGAGLGRWATARNVHKWCAASHGATVPVMTLIVGAVALRRLPRSGDPQGESATGTVAPSDARGRVKDATPVVNGTAELVTSGADFDAIQSKARAKYGVMVPISRFFNKIGHIGKGPFPYGDIGVVVSPDA